MKKIMEGSESGKLKVREVVCCERLLLYGLPKRGSSADVRDPAYVVFAKSFDCAILPPRICEIWASFYMISNLYDC